MWLFLVACAPARPPEVPVIDELGYVAALREQRPDLFRSDCWNVVTLKPRYRDALLTGAETYPELLARTYDATERAEDLAWMASQQRALVAICEAHPGSGGCANICAKPCDACPDARLYGGSDARTVRPAGYPLCGAVGYTVGEGPGGKRYDPDGYVESWKVFFEFDDGYATSIPPERYTTFFDRLAAAGYRGDAKMVSMTAEPQRVRYQYNNVIVHAWSPTDARIAERVGLEVFGDALAGHGRGLDVHDRDWHTFLCEDDVATLSDEALAYVGFGTLPAIARTVLPLSAYVAEEAGVSFSWHPRISPELRGRVAAAVHEDLSNIRSLAPSADLGGVRIAVAGTSAKRGMGFHRSARWLTSHGYDADREGVIEIFDAQDYLDARARRPMALVPFLTLALDPTADTAAATAWFGGAREAEVCRKVAPAWGLTCE